MDPTRRYADLPTATHVTADGREVVHLRRRFLPDPSDRPVVATVTVVRDDRLDLVAARHLGESLAWWRIADDNRAMHPADLTATPGRRLSVRMPGGG